MKLWKQKTYKQTIIKHERIITSIDVPSFIRLQNLVRNVEYRKMKLKTLMKNREGGRVKLISNSKMKKCQHVQVKKKILNIE